MPTEPVEFTVEDYAQARFALVDGNQPAMRRDVDSHSPWVMFSSNHVLRFTDQEMFIRRAFIVRNEYKENEHLRVRYENQLAHSEDLQRAARSRNAKIKELEATIKEQQSRIKFLEEEPEVKAIAGVLGDFAVADEHNGTRDDLTLARHLHKRGMRVIKAETPDPTYKQRIDISGFPQGPTS